MGSKTRQRTVFQCMAMAVAMGAWSVGAPAWSQIVADPNAPGRQRPTVLSAGNGVALVNIQTPSAAGVSRNSYRQFDVGAPGAILNNSRGEAQTQLGGWVGGNPWLATGGARIILNEVNSSDPSRLKGPIEVAGQRAEVVIANPSGIQVDGAAFLNASGVTLTTGTPVFNGGALDAYLVQRGQVSVEGAGLDTRDADATAILARATQLNAALWAQRLKLVSGANTVDAASQLPTGAAPPTGDAPAFALDVAAVGGMYAGQIQLIGTEAGLGVNNQGVISAEGGPLQLRADGWLVNAGRLQSEGELQVQAKGVDNAAGAVIVGERVGLSAEAVTNGEGAVIAARGDLSIQARESISNRRGGLILSGADMALAADRIENRSARIEALGELDVEARVLINANEHLQTEVVSDGGGTTTRTLYFTPSGEVDASEIAWMAVKPLSLMQGSEGWNDYVLHARPWILTRASAEALGVSDPQFSAWYHGPEPYVPAGIVTVGHGDSEAQVWQDAQFNYRRGDPIWAALGVAPPPGEPPGPMPRPPVPDGPVPVDLSAYQRALAAWQDQAAPWAALGEKLGAVRSAINAELRPFDIYQTVTETRPALKTVHSEPGQILSGGGMRLNASERLSNQDSEIVAGGVLHTPGAAVDNQASEVAASLRRQGTAYTWGVVDHTCEVLTCQTHYGWVQTPIDQRIPIPLKVKALRQEQGAADAPHPGRPDLRAGGLGPAGPPGRHRRPRPGRQGHRRAHRRAALAARQDEPERLHRGPERRAGAGHAGLCRHGAGPGRDEQQAPAGAGRGHGGAAGAAGHGIGGPVEVICGPECQARHLSLKIGMRTRCWGMCRMSPMTPIRPLRQLAGGALSFAVRGKGWILR
ncbi:filamentous hemagglutinin N-terminal domain-containing protein [Hydrogenophaga sp. SNF1]|nr:filamentous hemagglutinin N-terminal domain-containing protein [Hydrogenophaga sp. SNF1]WQB83199.1 filamentous hemagglutinin N-terminal domain-containing protein [Hydrogenophaga sp. SNF1]